MDKNIDFKNLYLKYKLKYLTFKNIIYKGGYFSNIETFIKYYNNDKDNFCIFDNKKRQSIETYLGEITLENFNALNYEIRFLIRGHIHSFALLQMIPNNIVELTLLCSNIRFKDLKPGKVLLERIFEEFKDTKLLIIFPANPKLKEYYINIKKPIIDTEYTRGFLLYGKKELINETNGKRLFPILNIIENYNNNKYDQQAIDAYESIKHLKINNLDDIKNKII